MRMSFYVYWRLYLGNVTSRWRSWPLHDRCICSGQPVIGLIDLDMLDALISRGLHRKAVRPWPHAFRYLLISSERIRFYNLLVVLQSVIELVWRWLRWVLWPKGSRKRILQNDSRELNPLLYLLDQMCHLDSLICTLLTSLEQAIDKTDCSTWSGNYFFSTSTQRPRLFGLNHSWVIRYHRMIMLDGGSTGLSFFLMVILKQQWGKGASWLTDFWKLSQ